MASFSPTYSSTVHLHHYFRRKQWNLCGVSDPRRNHLRNVNDSAEMVSTVSMIPRRWSTRCQFYMSQRRWIQTLRDLSSFKGKIQQKYFLGRNIFAISSLKQKIGGSLYLIFYLHCVIDTGGLNLLISKRNSRQIRSHIRNDDQGVNP
jgi:hypothetical protein